MPDTEAALAVRKTHEIDRQLEQERIAMKKIHKILILGTVTKNEIKGCFRWAGIREEYHFQADEVCCHFIFLKC